MTSSASTPAAARLPDWLLPCLRVDRDQWQLRPLLERERQFGDGIQAKNKGGRASGADGLQRPVQLWVHDEDLHIGAGRQAGGHA